MAFVFRFVHQEFQQLCIDAFLALRRHGSLLVRLFLLMVPAGMPELRYPSDVEYLRDKVRGALCFLY